MSKYGSSLIAHSISRRRLLQGTAGCGMAFLLDKSGLAMPVRPAGPATLDLGGDMWTLRENGTSRTIQASVPGSTYSNLISMGTIPNPYYRENNGEVQWVAEKTWHFERTFHLPDDLHDRQFVHLVCYGLDTLATLELNGHEIGRTDNMFRKWTFDIKPHLHRGSNHLRIQFDPLTAYVEGQRKRYQKEYGIDLANQRSWVRKAPYMWGWDWCRPVLTQGIWKEIEILGYDVQIADVGVLQNHLPDGAVQLEIHTELAGRTSGTQVEVEVSLADDVAATAMSPAGEGDTVLHAIVHSPQLWWPNGMGNQPLYMVRVTLRDAEGQCIDSAMRRVGLRTIEVVPPDEATALHLCVNGVAVFAKGADWIPADNMPTRVTPEDLRWYMTNAADSNFNFIRLWGGGYYEEDALFDICDELGLMLQFEFKFANASYPVRDDAWMQNLLQEVQEQTRRCRSHPSIVIWSGNNEIGFFPGYDRLFGDVIGGAVRRLVPGAFYEVGSGAHGSGDIHSWGVWHGDKPVESFLQVEGFVTEFGMQSTCVPATVRTYTDPSDRQSIFSPVMRYHERDVSGHGTAIIMSYTEANFGTAPESFDDTLWLTNLNQAWMVRFAVEHWRRDMPRSMAAVIWQYNDCWPCSSWSMVDYCRRAKPLFYHSKHFFAPVVVSGLPHVQTGQAEIYVTSDQQRDITGEFRWCVTNAAGEMLRHGTKEIDIPARSSRLVETLDLSDLAKAIGISNLLIWPEVNIEGLTVARNTLLFGRPKALKLQQPNLSVSVSGGETQYRIVIQTDMPALWVWAALQDTDASYSDNFIDLRRERAAEIDIVLPKPMTPYEFRSKLQLRSVWDVAPEIRG